MSFMFSTRKLYMADPQWLCPYFIYRVMNRTLNNLGNQIGQLYLTNEGAEKLMHKERNWPRITELMGESGIDPRGILPQ